MTRVDSSVPGDVTEVCLICYDTVVGEKPVSYRQKDKKDLYLGPT